MTKPTEKSLVRARVIVAKELRHMDFGLPASIAREWADHFSYRLAYAFDALEAEVREAALRELLAGQEKDREYIRTLKALAALVGRGTWDGDSLYEEDMRSALEEVYRAEREGSHNG